MLNVYEDDWHVLSSKHHVYNILKWQLECLWISYHCLGLRGEDPRTVWQHVHSMGISHSQYCDDGMKNITQATVDVTLGSLFFGQILYSSHQVFYLYVSNGNVYDICDFPILSVPSRAGNAHTTSQQLLDCLNMLICHMPSYSVGEKNIPCHWSETLINRSIIFVVNYLS